MIRSIRTFLLFNLFLSVTLVSLLTIIGNLFLEHRNFQTHLDSQLTLAAYTIRAFISSDMPAQQVKHIQKRMNHIPEYMHTLNFKYDEEIDDLNLLLKSIQFQIWSHDGKLILHSFAAPQLESQDMSNGFHNIVFQEHTWRAFALNLTDSQIKIVVFQRDHLRAELERQITEDSIAIMMVTYPFLALLIWIIVGRGLASITSTAEAIKRRAPNKLNNIETQDTPQELLPLIEALNALFNRLSEAFAREKRFASNAAHELRTPLAVLNTQTQVAMESKDVTHMRAALKKVLKSINRSTHVVQQLLTLSRLVPDDSINEPSRVNLKTIASEMIIELLPLADKKKISIALVAPDSDTSILGNKTALLILLRNLIDNALRYSPENTEVTVKIENFEHQITLSVIDNGPGISEEFRQRVFERFFRVLGTQTEGSGLGLNIVKQIVDLHKGSIELITPKTHSGLEIKITLWKDFNQPDPLI